MGQGFAASRPRCLLTLLIFGLLAASSCSASTGNKRSGDDSAGLVAESPAKAAKPRAEAPKSASSCASDYGEAQMMEISRLAGKYQELQPPDSADKMDQYLRKQESQVAEIRRHVVAWGSCLSQAPAKIKEFQRAYVRWADAELDLLAVTRDCYKLSYPYDMDCVEEAAFGDVGFRLYDAMDDLSRLHQEALELVGR